MHGSIDPFIHTHRTYQPPPVTNPRHVSHNSVALDLCVSAAPKGVYTLMGPELGEDGWVKDPIRLDWATGKRTSVLFSVLCGTDVDGFVRSLASDPMSYDLTLTMQAGAS